MSNTLIIKNTSVPGRAPTAIDLEEAELALNTADKTLFSKDAAGNVIVVGASGSHQYSGGNVHAEATINAAGFLSATDKAKLNGIEAGAQVNTVSSVAGKTGEVALTKSDVGLANVDNTSDLNKPISTATQAALDAKADVVTTYTKTEVDNRILDVVGAAPAALDTLAEIAAQLQSDESAAAVLTNTLAAKADQAYVDTQLATKVDIVSGKGLSTEDYTTTEKTKLFGIEAGAQVNTVTSVAGKTGTVALVKVDVGLGNVDNTSDLNKPISTATQAALDLKANLTDLATINGGTY